MDFSYLFGTGEYVPNPLFYCINRGSGHATSHEKPVKNLVDHLEDHSNKLCDVGKYLNQEIQKDYPTDADFAHFELYLPSIIKM